MAEIKAKSILRDLVAELSGDKRKATVLGVLLLVGLVVGVKAFTGGKPAGASAMPMNNPREIAVPQARPQDETADMEQKDKTRRDQYLQQMEGGITRDIFLADLELFPRKNVEPVKVLRTATTSTAPSEGQEELDRRLVQVEARSLVLESTMVGQSSIASINGKILRVGEWFSGFEIVRIAAHSCVVRKKDVTVVLEINK